MNNEDDISVRVMQIEDIDSVVDVHLKGFENFFLTFLGKQFLQIFYTAVLLDTTSLCCVVEIKGTIVGFAVGTTSPTGFSLRLLKSKWVAFVKALIIPVTKSPKIIFRLLGAFNRNNTKGSYSDCFHLLSITVAPGWQGYGLGRALVDYIVSLSVKFQKKGVYLTTDAEDNKAVIDFYERQGFKRSGAFRTPQGRLMREYVKYI